MHRPLRLLLALAGLGCSATLAAAQEPPAPSAPDLSTEEMATALKLDAVTIPTPGELLAAVDKLGKPDWASALRPPIPTIYTSRQQMALNIGGLIADGFIAVEAQDAQQVKNIGRDIMSLAKPLGVQQDILNRGKSLTDFAEHGQWDVLKEELEATQNEVKASMSDNKDPDLIVLVTLGGWIRAINAMGAYVDAHYSEDGARLLRQPAVAHFLSEKLGGLPAKLRDESSVKRARMGLMSIELAVSFAPATVPGKDAVHDLTTSTDELLKELSRKR